MKRLVGKLLALPLAAALLAGATFSAQAESTWERVRSSGELKFAVFNYPPYFVKDKATNEWGGALVEMVKDVAKEMKVDLNMVEVGGLERARARDLDREGRHGGRDAGDPGARHRHRLRGPHLLDRVGHGEPPGLRGQGLGGLQRPERQGGGDDRHLRPAPPREVGSEGDPGAVQGGLPDHPRGLVREGPTPSPPPFSPA